MSVSAGTVTARGSWNGMECMIQDTFHNRISIFSTLATDFILLTLMLIGLFRWKEALQSGGIFQLMYAQVDLFSSLCFHQLTRTAGSGVGSCCSFRRGPPCSEFQSSIWTYNLSLTVDLQVLTALDLNGM
jgi:hypothetical protein